MIKSHVPRWYSPRTQLKPARLAYGALIARSSMRIPACYPITCHECISGIIWNIRSATAGSLILVGWRVYASLITCLHHCCPKLAALA